MPFLLKGALIEYGTDLIGPIPNVILFQFNPEEMSRSLQIPQRESGSGSRENHQAGEKPVESISFKAHFSAADALGDNNGLPKSVLAQAFGIGPQLAALEKMVMPSSKIAGLIGEAIDAIGDSLGLGGDETPDQPIPREPSPRLLFIWGLTRVLPVTITSMSISEKKYDHILNPVQAEVDLSLTVLPPSPCADDILATGAWEYSQIAKEAQAIANLANTVQEAVEMFEI